MQDFLDLLLPITIAIIMFGIGLGLTIEDFKRVFIQPKAVLYGVFGQLFVLPLVGFIIAFSFPLEPVYQLGIILLSICPGGTSSNIVTYMLKGSVALSVTITSFNSLLIIVSIPLFLELALSIIDVDYAGANISLLHTYKEVALTVLLPIVSGVLIKHFIPSQVDRLQKPLRYLLPGLLFVVFTLVLLVEKDSGNASLGEYGYLVIPALLLNLMVMFIGFYSSRMVGLSHSDQFTIAIEMGLQNSVLAIFLANSVLQIDGLAIIAVLYGSFSFFSTLIVAYIMKNYMHKKSV